MNSKIIGPTSRKVMIFSLHVYERPAGAQDGFFHTKKKIVKMMTMVTMMPGKMPAISSLPILTLATIP